RDDGVDMGVVLELPAPGMEDPGAPREVSADEALVVGQPLESRGRRLAHRLVREALMGAEEGAECLRDGEGEEEGRPRELCVQVMLEPLLGFMLLAVRAVAVATGMIDAMLLATTGALREAMAVVSALALLDGTDHLAVREGEVGGALQVCWSKSGEDSTQGG